VEYHYGNSGTNTLTFTQQANPSLSDSSLSGYWCQYVHCKIFEYSNEQLDSSDDISRYFTGHYQKYNNSLPTIHLLPEFRVTNSVVTLIFVRSNAVFYFEPSYDPIFPAEQNYTGSGSGYLRQLYYNSLPHATVLGCADTIEIRDPDTGTIWQPKTMDWNNLTSLQGIKQLQVDTVLKQGMLNSFLLLGEAMLALDISSIIMGGPHLDAQKKIMGRFSTSINREQWKVEARKIFETSLARIQGDILDIARGRGVADKNTHSLFWEMNSPICSMIKFPTLGWSNISLFWVVILPTFAFFLWVFSIEVEKRLVLIWFYLYILKPIITLMWSLLKLVRRSIIFSLRRLQGLGIKASRGWHRLFNM
jgi:hypothetical protein